VNVFGLLLLGGGLAVVLVGPVGPTRVVRLLGQALVWSVVLVAAAVALVLSLPVLVLAAVGRGLVELGRALTRRGEDDTYAEPDLLDGQLRAEIDGGGEADLGDLLAGRILPCGCEPTSGVTTRCPGCGWWSCLAHRGAPHLCDPSDPIRSWQNAPLPPAVAASVNDAFAALVNSSDLADMRWVDRNLQQFYAIGNDS